MDVQIITTTKLVLTLDEDEAAWLQQAMQNPFNPHVTESKRDAEMRERFWNAVMTARND